MATRYVEEATAQLAPSYDVQQQAIQSQVPAVQKLYDNLVQGLEGQRQVESQNILESANRRGVLRSSLPVDLQTELGKALLAQRGQLDAQRAGDIAGINSQLGTLGIQRTQNIAELARALESQDLAREQLALEKSKISAASAQSSALAALTSKINQPSQQQSQSPLGLEGVAFKDPSRGGAAGFNFSFGGKPISAVGLAQVQGLNPADIIYSIAASGDQYAANAYREIVSNGGQVTPQLAQKYSALFWGTNLLPQTAQTQKKQTSAQKSQSAVYPNAARVPNFLGINR